MSNGTKVKKRDGRIEPLDLDKMHLMVEEATKGLAGVSASQVEMTSGIQFYDGITTAEIQEILIKSASDLIDLDHPNYQFVAARLLLFAIRKQMYGKMKTLPTLIDHITEKAYQDLYDKDIFVKYSKEEIEKADTFIDHERDFLFTYAGLRQVVDKYLVQDRSSGKVYETPQFMYMMIALTIFRDYPKATRMSYVKRYYDAISRHRLNIPTPIMAWECELHFDNLLAVFLLMLMTPSIASLALIWPLADTLHKGRASASTQAESVASTLKSEVEKCNTQVLYLSLKSLNQLSDAVHRMEFEVGSATVHFPIWHQEIEDILVLKNNKGTEDNRVRKLDYSIQLSKLFYERFIQNKEITLFSPHSVPGLYESFGTPAFDDLYCKYESDESIPKSTIGAQELILNLLKERAETGRVYIMNIDHCNSHSSFKDKVEMSNLCQEITLPTYPLQHIDDHTGEIALCILSAINVGKVRSDDELEDLCDLAVRGLEELIDYQEYPVTAAEVATKARRSLGIGFIGLAHYLAKLGYSYGSQEAWDAVHGLSESFQYYLLKSSNKLAQEKGHCEYFGRTKYADGILPIDTYKKDVDEITSQELAHDWESLRASINQYGLRHSTLSTQMPSESSSVVSNATNGIEPPRDFLSIKKSKKGPLKQIVPSYTTLKNNYTLLWEMPDNTGYINVVSVMQKFFDQAISGNWSYNPENYPNNEVPVSQMANDLLTTYKYGWKTSYYQNTHDMKSDEIEEEKSSNLSNLLEELEQVEEGECESCAV